MEIFSREIMMAMIRMTIASITQVTCHYKLILIWIVQNFKLIIFGKQFDSIKPFQVYSQYCIDITISCEPVDLVQTKPDLKFND